MATNSLLSISKNMTPLAGDNVGDWKKFYRQMSDAFVLAGREFKKILDVKVEEKNLESEANQQVFALLAMSIAVEKSPRAYDIVESCRPGYSGRELLVELEKYFSAFDSTRLSTVFGELQDLTWTIDTHLETMRKVNECRRTLLAGKIHIPDMVMRMMVMKKLPHSEPFLSFKVEQQKTSHDSDSVEVFLEAVDQIV